MEPNCSRKVNSNCSRRFYLWESGIRMLTVLRTFHFLTLVYEKYDGNSPTLIAVFDSSDSPNGCECEEKIRVTHTHRWNADVAQNSFSCAQHWEPCLS